MPYKLSGDGKSVMVRKGGRWRVLKRHKRKEDARKHLFALRKNVNHK
jgi:hypothetical protein